MAYNYQTSIFKLPSSGVFILEMILPPEAADNVIGDLAEEYCAKSLRESSQSVRWWFLRQVYSTVWLSIREGGVGRLLLKKAGYQYWKPFRKRLASFDSKQFVRQTPSRRIAALTVLFSLSTLFLSSTQHIQLEELLAENEKASRLLVPLEEVQSYESTPSKKNKTPATPAPRSAALEPSQRFTATAYALPGRTASGHSVRRGLIAADKSLPLGTRVRLDAGRYSGEYLVADRGSRVRGRIIDIWVPSNGESIRFGRRPVKLTILSYGAKKHRSSLKTA